MLIRFLYIFILCLLQIISINTSAQIAMPDSVCEGYEKHYNVDPNPIAGSTYTWKINGITQVSSIINNIDITWNTAGTFLLEVQEKSVDGCLGPLRMGQVFVSPTPVFFLNSNSPVCEDSPIEFSSQTIDGGTYLWTGPNGFISSSQNPIVLSSTSILVGTYFLTVSANGCPSIPSPINIIVNNCIVDLFIPEGFSPNNDGINDFFVIRGLDNYTNNKIIIFNRWGSKIFEASPYYNNWKGDNLYGLKVGGNDLPTGTYFYLLDLGNGSQIVKGSIYLNR